MPVWNAMLVQGEIALQPMVPRAAARVLRNMVPVHGTVTQADLGRPNLRRPRLGQDAPRKACHAAKLCGGVPHLSTAGDAGARARFRGGKWKAALAPGLGSPGGRVSHSRKVAGQIVPA